MRQPLRSVSISRCAEDVDLANGVIRVEFGWEYREGQIPLKSDAGRRKVPISAVLRDFLDARIAASGYSGRDRFFGLARGESTFDPSKLTKRADEAWRDAGLERITLHECRHAFASLMIAAGVKPRHNRPSWATRTFRSRWIATAT